MKREEIHIKNINLKDERFRISYFFSLKGLLLSLKEVGLINPPLVTSRNRQLILVSGWKRVLACLELSLTSIPVWVVRSDDDLQMFLLAFYENLASREYSLLEKAEILRRLKKLGEKEQKIIRHYFPLLNIPQTSYYLDLYLTISRFSKDVKSSIHQKNMSLASMEIFAEFNSRERKLLLPLLQPLGQNKQQELLEDLHEISLRDSVSAQEILISEGMSKILHSEKFSSLQKSDRIRHWLRRKRYPRLSSRRKAFKQALRKSGWPEDISIEPSPFFEEEALTVQFRFKDKEELRSLLVRLQQISSKKEFAEVFEELSDE
jgi:ParB family chromosome partitioning protein